MKGNVAVGIGLAEVVVTWSRKEKKNPGKSRRHVLQACWAWRPLRSLLQAEGGRSDVRWAGISCGRLLPTQRHLRDRLIFNLTGFQNKCDSHLARTKMAEPGGFLPQKSLPSPAPSGTSTRLASGLPHPRAHPLRAGSAKEDKIRVYIENQLMNINRRFVKKFQPPKPGDDLVGYKNVGELCKDIEALVDIIWLSGTRTFGL